MAGNANEQGGRDKRKRLRQLPLDASGREPQHFLLSAAAVTIREADISKMGEEAAYAIWKSIRFADNGGQPQCPYEGCRHPRAYEMMVNRRGVQVEIFKCSACRRQFSATTGTPLSSRKKPWTDILHALLVFINGVSGNAALRLRRAESWSYKTCFVVEHKMREAIALSRDERKLSGTVEVDSTFIGGSQRKATMKKDRRGRKKPHPNKQNIIAVRERGPNGEIRVMVTKGAEQTGTKWATSKIVRHSQIVSDEAWSFGHHGDHSTVNHKEGLKINGVDTNQVESFFARFKRGARGVYYRVAGECVDLYAEELAWREDYRRRSNGEQLYMLVKALSRAPVSKRWTGYWQRWQQPGARRRNRSWMATAVPT